MQVHLDISLLPAFRNAVITIGTFDGVHSGHRKIIELMRQEKEKVQGEAVIITFDPHPRHVLGTTKGPLLLLSTLEEKSRLLESQGIDHLVVVPFTAGFSAMGAEQYIREFLVQTFHPHTIIIGYDHRFGQNRQGDFRLLESQAPLYNFRVKEIPALVLQDITISSTRIREALQRGDIYTANQLLGYTYFFSGTVVKGNQLGRRLGYPTANIVLGEKTKLLPGNGVYAVQVQVNDEQEIRNGMMNIGVRPTVDGTRLVTEVHIFGFDRDIYGETLTVRVLAYLRGEKKFSGLEALKQQLDADQQQTLQYFG